MGTLTTTPRRHERHGGFTLVELGVTIAIIAVLATIAMPPMINLILTQHVKSGASNLQTALFYARSEAVKRAANVDIVPVSNDWKSGWKVQLADGTVLRAQSALDSQLTSMPVNAGEKVTYQSDGHIAAALGSMIVRISTNPKVTARCVVVDLSGRASVVADTDGNPLNGCN
jgi:type IV fimbrial biogenesis protein FimT